MAVAYSTHTPNKGTGTSLTASITVSGTNPVVLIGIGIDTNAVNSVGFAGTGTPAQIADTVSTTCRGAVYAIPAPSGSGNVTLTPLTSAAMQLDVALFTGADQTTPCPTADADVSTSASSSQTRTPANLASGDASYGSQAHTIAEDCSSVSPNEIYRDSSTSVNMQTGYATNTTGVTFALTGGSAQVVSIAVRIKQPAAGNVTVTPSTLALVTTKYAPTVSTPRLCTPGKLSQTLTAFAPQIKLTVIPTTKALTITTFAPTVLAPRLCTPGKLSLTITKYAPTVSTPRLCTPGKLSLTLATFSPTVSLPKLVTPDKTSLTLTAYAPAPAVAAVTTRWSSAPRSSSYTIRRRD